VSLSVEYRTCDQEVVGSSLGRARGVEIMGKFVTPTSVCASVHQEVQVGTGQRAVMTCGWGVRQVLFVCGWQVKLCDPLVTRGPYLSALEVQHNKALYKSTFTLLYF